MKPKFLCFFVAVAGLAQATTVTIVFNTGAGLLTPPTIVTGSISPNGSTSGVNLGSNLRIQDPNQLTSVAAIITGTVNGNANNLYCQAASVASQCAANATSDPSSAAGHASGLGIGEGRINDTDLLTITAQTGYVVRLISFQVTAMIGPGGATETGFYNLGGSNISFSGGNLPIDALTVNSAPFTILRFGAPTGGPNGGNTYALHSLTLDIESPTPEPATWALTGIGLVAVLSAQRRSRQKPPGA